MLSKFAAGCAALLLASSVPAQLPAGSRDAADHSRENAAGARLRDAESALERRDFAGAAKLLRVLAAERPKDAHVLYDLGFAQERTDAEAEAAQSYASAIAADPAFAEPRVALGLLDARAGRTEKAHAEFTSVAQQAGAAPELRARSLRALAQMDADARPAQASDDLLQAIKLTGETSSDIALSATLASRAGDTSGALGEYRRLLKLNPDDADAAAGLAHALAASGNTAEAESVLAAPLQMHPGDPRLISQMAAALAAQGKTKEAIPLLVRLHGDPKFAGDVAVKRQLARLYALDGQNAEAEAMFRRVLIADDRDPAVMDDLGSVLVREQKYAEAEALLTKAVSARERFENKEAFGDAAGHLAFAASKNNHPQACLQALALRATVQPNSGPSLFLEATAHDTLHQYKEAQRAYRAFLALAGGQFPDQEFQARHRLVALEHMK